MKPVRVTFVNADSGATIGEREVPPDQLPESFAVDTTLDIGEDSWTVLKAEPAEGFRETGSLTLHLRRMEKIDPSKILFSIPTINDGIPAEGPGSVSGALEILEDDWRQIELIHLGFEDSIKAEMQEVRAIYENAREGEAFREIHVRKRITTPLENTHLTPTDLMGFSTPHAGLKFAGSKAIIPGGFACRLNSGSDLYGTHTEEVFDSLCLPPGSKFEEGLLRLARQHELALVDWCRCWVVMPEEEEYEQFFI